MLGNLYSNPSHKGKQTISLYYKAIGGGLFKLIKWII